MPAGPPLGVTALSVIANCPCPSTSATYRSCPGISSAMLWRSLEPGSFTGVVPWSAPSMKTRAPAGVDVICSWSEGAVAAGLSAVGLSVVGLSVVGLSVVATFSAEPAADPTGAAVMAADPLAGFSAEPAVASGFSAEPAAAIAAEPAVAIGFCAEPAVAIGFSAEPAVAIGFSAEPAVATCAPLPVPAFFARYCVYP